jgi:hypothetical protein
MIINDEYIDPDRSPLRENLKETKYAPHSIRTDGKNAGRVHP